MKLEKMMVYNMREYDELSYFNEYARQYGFDITYTTDTPVLENAHLAEGCRYVNVITTPISRELLEAFKKQGVSYIVTRTIGYDHIDVAAAKELGIKIANTPYGPNGVAEYTLMLMLMCIRKMKSISRRFAGQDYTLKGLIGRELSEMTVGVIGTGSIGVRLIEMLSGFGCEILAYSPHVKPGAEKYARYVSMDELLEKSDIITLHSPANEKTNHMLNAEAFAKMKEGAVIVNTARGALIDTQALIDALNSGKISAAGLDVVEDEAELYYYDCREKVLSNGNLYLLANYPNVIITHHMAFYTRQCVETMVCDSLRGAACDAQGRENGWLVY